MEKKYSKHENGVRYEGEIKNRIPDGYGVVFFTDRIIIYEGYWKNGKPNGKGTLFRVDGTKVYEGMWEKGIMHGQGIAFLLGGREKLYEGEFKYGHPSPLMQITAAYAY